MSWHKEAPATSASQSWRSTMSAVRQEARNYGLVSHKTLASALDVLAGTSSDVKDHEVGEDLSFLVQQLNGAPSAEEGVEGRCPHTSFCRLSAVLAQTRKLQLSANAANMVFSTLRQCSDGNVKTSPVPATLQQEALAALLVLAPDNFGVLAVHERAALLAQLQALLVPPGGDAKRSGPGQLEVQRLSLQALAALCGGSGQSSLSPDEAAGILAAVAGQLQRCTTGARPVEDAAHSRMYAALVKALHAALGEAKRSWASRAAVLVHGLRRFLVYGAQPAPVIITTVAPPNSRTSTALVAGAAAAADGGGGGGSPAAGGQAAEPGVQPGGRYQPPHSRRRESSANSGGSDSEASDNEAAASAAGADRFKSSRVRVGVLTCLQVMAKSDSRALHQHWTSLLPTQAPLQPQPLSPSLVTMLLYDPLPKVRGHAASTIAVLLEGAAQRAFLAVAEAKAVSAQRAPVRGFVTLSLSLGLLVTGLHAGVLAAVAREHSVAVLGGVLRALCVMLSAVPYERLPPELLPDVVKAVRARRAALSAAPPAVHPLELAQVHTAALACLAEAFSTKAPMPGLAAYLQSPGSGPGALVHELLGLCGSDTPAVQRIEALGALKGLATNYMFALPEIWKPICATASSGLGDAVAAAAAAGTGGGAGAVAAAAAAAGAGAAGGPSQRQQPPPMQLQQPHFALPPQAQPGRGWGRGQDRAAPHPHTPPSPSPGAPSSARQGQPQQRGSPGSGSRQPPSAASSFNSRSPAAAAEPSASSASPEDKATQLALKLMSDYLAAQARRYGLARSDALGAPGDASDAASGLASPSVAARVAVAQQRAAGSLMLSPGSTASEEEVEAAVERLAAMWRDALRVVAPAAVQHAAFMVRAAALACLDELPEAVYARLDPALQRSAVQLLTGAATGDAVAAVRSSACKSLGLLATFPGVMDGPELSAAVSRALAPCVRDNVVSVRISAAWAVANACDAHRRRLDPRHLQHQATAKGEASGSAAAERVLSHSHATTSAPAGSPAPQPLQPQLLQPHHLAQLGLLCSLAVAAVQDTDKVRANGIRAIGQLLASVTPQLGLQPEGGLDAFLDGALTSLQSCMTTGNMKVQWNACYAALGLFQNAPLLAHPYAAARLSPLLLLLVMLVRDSANFKIRTHAAAALASLGSREAYKDVFTDALVVTAGALEALQAGAGGAAGQAADRGAGAGADDLAGGPSGASGGSGGGGAAAAAGDAEAEGGKFPNYRYAAGLAQQLRSTLVHLLGLARGQDAMRVREALAKRADFVHGCLMDLLAEAVQALRPAAAAAAATPAGLGESGGKAADAPATHPALELPPDPFGLTGAAAEPGAQPEDVRCGTSLITALEGLKLGPLLALQPQQRSSGGGGAAAGVMGAGQAPRQLHIQVEQLAEEAQAALVRLQGVAGAVAGFVELLQQLGPAVAEGPSGREAHAVLQALRRTLA